MSFLAPLYALAALAILGPVALHLVRKRPKEVVEFSSLMFLESAPPHLTGRSRIEQWLLMSCRAGFVGLLAVAFARPYWNTLSGQSGGAEQGVRRLLLIDTSASMQREGVWAQVREAANGWLESSNPADVLSVYSFANEVEACLPMQQALTISVESRPAAARAAIARIEPGWGAGRLGAAIAEALDAVQMEYAAGEEPSRLEIALITDLGVENELEGSVGFEWPKNARLRVFPVRADLTSNAVAMILPSRAEDDLDRGNRSGISTATLGEAADSGKSIEGDSEVEWWRVRVTHATGGVAGGETAGGVVEVSREASNRGDSEGLELHWLDREGRVVPGSRVTSRVPKGMNAVVKVRAPKGSVETLELRGDGCEFDNRRYVTAKRPQSWTIGCIESMTDRPEASVAYFLERVPFSDGDSIVEVVRWEPGAFPGSVESEVRSALTMPWLIASHGLMPEDLVWLKSYMDKGGHLLWVWDQSAEGRDGTGARWGQRYAEAVRDWTGDASVMVEEAVIDQYSLMTRVDLKSSLFAPFADAKFNDFSKIRFWKHRRLTFDGAGGWSTAASYDSGLPTIVSKPVGAGRLTILTAGWQPTESQLALSSKFVPMMSQMFAEAKPRTPDLQLESGTMLDEATLDGFLRRGERADGELDEGGLHEFLSPTGERLVWDSARQGWPLSVPGIYRMVMSDGGVQRLAVNVPMSESNPSTMAMEALSRTGVLVDMGLDPPARRDEARQLAAGELEAKQSGWWWLLAMALVVVAIESILCLRGSKVILRPSAAT